MTNKVVVHFLNQDVSKVLVIKLFLSKTSVLIFNQTVFNITNSVKPHSVKLSRIKY